MSKLAPAVYTPMPAYMADPRMMFARFIDGDGAGGTTPPEETPAAPKPEAPAQDPTDWKVEARKWEQRAKENSKAAERLAEIEEASKTAEQKAAERLAALEKENAGLKASQLRSDVAVEKGLPAKLAKFLQGSTREELEASAAELLELNKPAGPVIRGQERSPGKVGEDPLREFTRSLFSSTSD